MNESILVLPPDSAYVRHPAMVKINSDSVLLFCAASLLVSLGITDRKVAWLSRAALAGVIGYAFQEYRQLENVQVEWFRIDSERGGTYLGTHLNTWKMRSPERVIVEKEIEEEEIEELVEGDCSFVVLLNAVAQSVIQFVLPDKDPKVVAYEQAWLTQLDVLDHRLRQRAVKNPYHYVVGMWKDGWLESVMLLEYADGQEESSLGTPRGKDNVLLLTLMTAPWNLCRRQGWAQSVFLIGLRGLFPGGIKVFCKPEKCQPVDYFEEYLGFNREYLGFNREEGGVLSKKFPPWGELWEKLAK